MAHHLRQAFSDHRGNRLSKSDLETLVVVDRFKGANGKFKQGTWQRAIDTLVSADIVVKESPNPKSTVYYMPFEGD